MNNLNSLIALMSVKEREWFLERKEIAKDLQSPGEFLVGYLQFSRLSIPEDFTHNNHTGIIISIDEGRSK